MTPNTGAFVCVVGPSGVGKDTLIALARDFLQHNNSFYFVRRLVTRTADASEDHGTISEAEFLRGVDNDAYALSWRAHGLAYAVPMEVCQAVESGAIAVCNLSRTAIDAARERFRRVFVVRLDAPSDLVAVRLATRRREGQASVAERLQRKPDLSAFAADCVISNDGRPEDAAWELVAFLEQVAAGKGAPHPEQKAPSSSGEGQAGSARDD